MNRIVITFTVPAWLGATAVTHVRDLAFVADLHSQTETELEPLTEKDLAALARVRSDIRRRLEGAQ